MKKFISCCNKQPDCFNCKFPDCKAADGTLFRYHDKYLEVELPESLPNPVKHYEIEAPTWEELYPGIPKRK